MGNTILIVDDDNSVAEILKVALANANYDVKHVRDANSGYTLIQKEKIDLLVLDHNLPGISGMGLLEILKKDPRTATLPVIMLTVRGEERYKIKSLETGADDYVVKPVAAAELVARVRAILRRIERGGAVKDILEFEGVKMDLEMRGLWVDGKRIELTPTEWDLLTALARRRGMVFKTEVLIDMFSKGSHIITSDTIYVYINALRKKLGRHGSLIETIRGVGYRLAPEG